MGDEVKRWVPWLVAIALFMENLDATIVNTAVPTMSASLGVEPLSLKGVLTSYTLCLAVFIPISGWMADRFGTRRVFFTAVGLFSLGSLLCGLALSVPMLVGARVVQGAGGAMMTPVGRLALLRSFPRSETLRALNFVVIPALVGPLVGPFLGGLVVHWLHWRVIFFVNLPVGLVGLWLVQRHMPDYRDAQVAPLDVVGFTLFGAGIALLSYVLEVFGTHHLESQSIGFLFVLSLVLLAVYALHARRADAPVLDLHVFSIRTFRVSVVGGALTRLGLGGMPFLVPLLLQLGLGFPAWQAGLFMMPQAAAAIAMKVLSGRLLARFGHRTALLANTVVVGATMLAFAAVDRQTPLGLLVALTFAQGFASALQFTSINTLAYADVPDRRTSMAGSIASTAQMLSLSFGVAVGSLVTEFFVGGAPQADPALMLPALHRGFVALGAFTIASAAVFATLHATDGDVVSRRAAAT